MELLELFVEVKKKYPEVQARLRPFDKPSFMFSSPLTKNIYYNKKQLDTYCFSPTALKGALAHELAHKVQWRQHSFLWRLLLVNRYKKNAAFRREIEREADIIAVKRGFGRELLQLIKESREKFSPDRWKRLQETHLSEEEILLAMNH